MKTFITLCVVFAAFAVVSALFHPSHHHHMHDEETSTESSESNEIHNETGNATHGHHHHHHHHKHHKHHHHHHHKHHWTCKDEPVKVNHDLIKAKKECHHEFKEAKKNNVEDRQRGHVCKSLCAGKKMGFFDENGQVVQSKVDELIDSMIESKEAQKEIKQKSVFCAKNNTAEIEDGPSDNKCTNYKPYVKCLWMASMEVCVKNFDAEDWE